MNFLQMSGVDQDNIGLVMEGIEGRKVGLYVGHNYLRKHAVID